VLSLGDDDASTVVLHPGFWIGVHTTSGDLGQLR
jgi:hypothetical protein